MKRDIVKPINPIQKRANAKIVDMNGRYFLIGGMTITKATCDIYQFRITNPQQQKYEVQWRPLKFQNHIFTPRNSFSACVSDSKIYIWGGLQSNQAQMTQKCLSDLIEVDIQKGKMRQLNLKQKIFIHSACLYYDKSTNSLIAFGGTNQNSSMQAYLYTLELGLQEENKTYQWNKKSVKNVSKEGVLWQHTFINYDQSLFDKKQGKLGIIIGGCRYPWTPYKSIIQIDLNSLEVRNSIDLQEAVVAHETVYDNKNYCAYIIGGANGGGFNRWIYKIAQGKIQKIEGHNAVGASCVLTPLGLIVYGGVCGPQMLNDMIIYR